MRIKMSSLKTGRRILRLTVAGACLLAGFPGIGQVAEPPPANTILQELRSFREMGSVLSSRRIPTMKTTS
jgi:hypothetical protein